MTSLAVTVSSCADVSLIARAEAAARTFGVRFLNRPKNTGLIAALGGQADAFLVLGHDGWSLRDGDGVALRFTPGMAALRVKRIDSGQGTDDVLVKLGELAKGDVVFDGTLGLGADALVCARVVGPSGRVIGVEASLPLYALVSEGIAAYPYASPLNVIHGDALEVLRGMPARSVDVAMFDPMFDRPKKSSPAFDLLRRFADHRPLTAETIEEAKRVARRWVVVKGGRHTNEFKRLELTVAPTSRFNSTVWARVPAASP